MFCRLLQVFFLTLVFSRLSVLHYYREPYTHRFSHFLTFSLFELSSTAAPSFCSFNNTSEYSPCLFASALPSPLTLLYFCLKSFLSLTLLPSAHYSLFSRVASLSSLKYLHNFSLSSLINPPSFLHSLPHNLAS